jgi:hypothetical protein
VDGTGSARWSSVLAVEPLGSSARSQVGFVLHEILGADEFKDGICDFGTLSL